LSVRTWWTIFSYFWLCSEILLPNLAMYDSLNQQKGIHITRICGPRFTVHAEPLKKNHSSHCLVHCICIATLLHLNTTCRPRDTPPVTSVSDDWEHGSFCFHFASFLSDYVTTIWLYFCWLSTMPQIKDILPCVGHGAK
jgi:hypothetical protein